MPRNTALKGGSVRVLRTVPTATGFITEHEETHPGTDVSEVARHAAEAPMIRP